MAKKQVEVFYQAPPPCGRIDPREDVWPLPNEDGLILFSLPYNNPKGGEKRVDCASWTNRHKLLKSLSEQLNFSCSALSELPACVCETDQQVIFLNTVVPQRFMGEYFSKVCEIFASLGALGQLYPFEEREEAEDYIRVDDDQGCPEKIPFPYREEDMEHRKKLPFPCFGKNEW